MKKQIKKLVKFIPVFLFIALTPLITFAQSGEVLMENAPDGLSGILLNIGDLLSAILPVLVAFGVIYFIWGVILYVIGDSEEAKKTGRDKIIYGIIGLAVIISIWGLVYLIQDTLGVGQDAAPDVTNLVTQASGTCTLGPKFQGLLNYATCIIGSSVIPFIFAIAMVFFIWGAVKFFIIDSDEEAKREQGKQFMLWGIIALAVMISVWGLVNVLGVTFNINTTYLPQVKP